MLVEEVMQKNVSEIEPMASVKEALKKMHKDKVKSLVVSKSNENSAYGLITFKNILNAVFLQDGDVELLRVYDICVLPAFQVSRKLDVKYAVSLMVHEDIKRLLVIDDNELKGIISMTDVVEHQFDLLD